MGGTGNFNRDNRTLYVGGIKSSRANLEVLLHIISVFYQSS